MIEPSCSNSHPLPLNVGLPSRPREINAPRGPFSWSFQSQLLDRCDLVAASPMGDVVDVAVVRVPSFSLVAVIVIVATVSAGCGLISTDGNASGSSDEPAAGQMIGPSSDIDMALEVLTRADEGGRQGSHRWDQKSVKIHISLPNYPDRLHQELSEVLAWITSNTGVQFTQVDDPVNADLTVASTGSNGGHVQVTLNGARIVHAEVLLGCCRIRPVWEELTQAMGPLGDRADGRSLFSQDQRLPERATMFDAWVLTALYGAPVGADESQLRSALEVAAEGPVRRIAGQRP